MLKKPWKRSKKKWLSAAIGERSENRGKPNLCRRIVESEADCAARLGSLVNCLDQPQRFVAVASIPERLPVVAEGIQEFLPLPRPRKVWACKLFCVLHRHCARFEIG